jgi:hypothetical protein
MATIYKPFRSESIERGECAPTFLPCRKNWAAAMSLVVAVGVKGKALGGFDRRCRGRISAALFAGLDRSSAALPSRNHLATDKTIEDTENNPKIKNKTSKA